MSLWSSLLYIPCQFSYECDVSWQKELGVKRLHKPPSVCLFTVYLHTTVVCILVPCSYCDGVCLRVFERERAVIKRLARIFLSSPLSQRATQHWSDKSSLAAMPLIVISFVQKSVLISAPPREMECGWVRSRIDFSLGAHSRVAGTRSWTWLTSHYCSPAASSFYSDQRPLLRFNLKLMRSEHVLWKCYIKK